MAESNMGWNWYNEAKTTIEYDRGGLEMVKIKHESKQLYANQTTNVGGVIPNTGPRRDSASCYLR